MSIYVQHDGKQLGPFTEAEIKTQLASGAISLQDHVWWEGQANWVQLGQSPFAAPLSPASPGPVSTVPSPLPVTPAVAPANATAPETSKLAIWALVCGCLSLLCGLFASIPAIILGHMGLKETKQNPSMQGHGMALAGVIIGYIFTAIFVLYLGIVGISVLIALGNQTKVPFTSMPPANSAPATTNSP